MQENDASLYKYGACGVLKDRGLGWLNRIADLILFSNDIPNVNIYKKLAYMQNRQDAKGI